MNTFKRFMTFSRSERIAIVTMVSVIVIILIVKNLVVTHPPKRDYFKHDLDSIVARRQLMLDSLRMADSIEKAEKSMSFRAKQTPHLSFRAKQREVEKSHLIADDASVPLRPSRIEVDINTADTTLLKQLPGIGSAFARWIVEYRERLGGYRKTEQLLEVYRMDSTRFYAIKDNVKIDSSFIPNRLRINSDAFKILLRHPYLEFDDVKKIVNHREQKGLITSWQQLVGIIGDEINPELQYYIDYQ